MNRLDKYMDKLEQIEKMQDMLVDMLLSRGMNIHEAAVIVANMTKEKTLQEMEDYLNSIRGRNVPDSDIIKQGMEIARINEEHKE